MSNCWKKSFTALQTFSKYVQYRRISQTASCMNITAPQPDGEPKNFSPKIQEIANNIANLNLLEVAELTDLLKKKLNLPDAPMMSFSGGFAPAAAAAAAEKKEEEAPEISQTSFSVKLVKFDEKQKVALIKEMKSQFQDLNLVQAKKLVEQAPVIIKDNIGKDEADALKTTLSKVGAEIEIV